MGRALGRETWLQYGLQVPPRAAGAQVVAGERARHASGHAAGPADGRDGEPTGSAEGLRVLLVEDNPGDVELVREALEQGRAGATLVCVARIGDALERALGGAFDVVLLDLSLPDSLELEGARRLHAAFPGLPIVVLTSLEDDRLAARAVAEGAQDYLVKGQIAPPLLVRALRYAVERQQYAERARLLERERSARLAAEAAERTARASERRFRAVLDQVQDYAIFLVDPAGRVTSWSAAARLLTGWAAEEILGKSFAAFFPPEDVARGAPGAELEHAAREGRIEDERWRVRKDGSRFLANVVLTALRDDEGGLLGFVKVTRDVTERRRAERNRDLLAQATEELASALDPVATLDRLVHVAVPRFADLCGVDLAREDGASGEFVAAAAVDPERERLFRDSRRASPVAAGAFSRVVEALRRGEPVFFPEVGEDEVAAIARSPEHLAYVRALAPRSFMAVPLRSRGGAYGSVIFAMTEPLRRFDRVDLGVALELARRAELAIDNARLLAETQRAVRVREDVLAVVSHDLKTPLTAVNLAAAAALRALGQGGDEARVRRQLLSIQRSTRQANVLLRDLLDMASIRAGRMSVRTAVESSRALLAEAVQTHEPLVREKGIALSWREPTDLPVRCDRARVLQVLSNLITNAVKFSGSGARVDVGMEEGDRFATFTVSDSGPGIPEDALPFVFEAYWSTARHRDQGTGLGLFISKGIVEAHGGRVWIESRVGEGTAVRFTLPIAAA